MPSLTQSLAQYSAWLGSGACHTGTCASPAQHKYQLQCRSLADWAGPNTHLIDCFNKTLELILSLSAVLLILQLLCAFCMEFFPQNRAQVVGDVRTKIKVIGAHVSLAAAGRVYLISFWSGSNLLLIIKYRNFYKNSDHFNKNTTLYNK